MTQPAVEVRGLWKRFRRGERHDSLRDLLPALAGRLLGRRRTDDLRADEFWSLRGVEFALERGAALGVIGPNGAGKSTLFKVLSRVLRPDRGSVTVNGRLGALLEVTAGFSDDLTGRENVYLSGVIQGLRRREVAARFDRIVDFAGLSAFIDTPVKRYSSGMKARLGFAVAAHLDPDVLLVDEVLAVGDAAFRARCLERMAELRRAEGVTLLFVTHFMPQLAALCPTALVLDRGAVHYHGPSATAALRYHDLLRDAGAADRPAGGCTVRVTSDGARDDGDIAMGHAVHFDLFFADDAPADFHLFAAVTDADGRRVCSADSKAWGVRIDPAEPVRISLDGVQLTPGHYRLDVYLKDPLGADNLVSQPAAASFGVSPEPAAGFPVRDGGGTGPVFWNPHWQGVTRAAPHTEVAACES